MSKCPYSFPLRTKADMVNHLLMHISYSHFPFAWNVKLYTVDHSGKRGEEKVDETLDDQWHEHSQMWCNEIWEQILATMSSQVLEGEYTTYPGDDQGDWSFALEGRSGGHLVLRAWHNKRFGEIDFTNLKHSDRDWWKAVLMGLSKDRIRCLYRAIVCMDKDFSSAELKEEYAFHLNAIRYEWEFKYRKAEAYIKAGEGLEPCPVI